MYQQVKFEVINPDIGENVFGGIAIVDDRNKTITNVICGCCGCVFAPEDIKILERYNTWVDLTETIIGDSEKTKHKTEQKMTNELYYRVVLYNDNTILPFLFNSWEEADNYISIKKLHAYITIM